MPLWQVVLEIVGGLLLLGIVLGAALVVRRRLLTRRGGSFECSINTRASTLGASRGWVLGVGRFRGGDLEWFRVFSLSPRPKMTFHRGDAVIDARREPVGHETFALYAGHVIVDCRTGDRTVRLGLAPSSLTALLAWSESSPPGRGTSTVV